jgi:hypothetical protein
MKAAYTEISFYSLKKIQDAFFVLQIVLSHYFQIFVPCRLLPYFKREIRP